MPDASPVSGKWLIKERNNFSVFAPSGYSCLFLGRMPDPCLIEMHVSSRKCGASFGLLLAGDEDCGRCHVLKFDASSRTMSLTGKPSAGDESPCVERKVDIKAGRQMRVRVCVDGSCIVAYTNDEVALSGRMYDRHGENLGLFAADGNVFFSGVTVKTISGSGP